ncbi:MAG: M48 family peptidase [Verrucomicrobiaceae bacterium]|nr:MAG: M48 family peptidase [Verrucomicrobiaceae bacterium]
MTFSNPWFTVLILSSVILFLLETVSVLLNLSRLRPELPGEFSDVFDAEAYAKSQAYTRESERFDLLSGAVKLVVFLAFWLGGGFGWLDGLVRGWTPSPILGGLAGLAVLSLGSSLLSWPFDWWDTFHIEEKYGFNKTTPKVFWLDRVKGLALSAVIGLPVMALLLWLFGRFPNAWLWAWLSVTVIILALQFLAPRYLMPIFNKFTPMPDGPLKTAIQELSARCRFPVKELFIIDGSKRSSKGNAFFAGFGKNKRIALYDTLIEKHTEPELLAVLAHEIGHFRRGHIVQRLALSVAQLAVVFLLMGLLLNNTGLFAAFGVEQPSVWLSIVFFMILFEPVQTVMGIFASLWSRKHEYEADAFAADAMRGPQALMDGLKRLARDNLSNLTPHPFHVFLHYSHPPMLERLAALRAWKG